MASDLEAKAQQLFERDPLVGALAIVVAGNSQSGAYVATVEGKQVMLPDWGKTEWEWWLSLCVDMARAMESAKPESALAMDSALGAAYQEATSLLSMIRSGEAGDTLRGEEVGAWAIGIRVFIAGGRLLAAQTVRVAKWAAPIVASAGKSAWSVARKTFTKAPIKVVAGTALLAAPDTAIKVVKSATKLAGGLFGAATSGIVAGLGPIGLAAIAAVVYFGFFHGKSE